MSRVPETQENWCSGYLPGLTLTTAHTCTVTAQLSADMCLYFLRYAKDMDYSILMWLIYEPQGEKIGL